MSVSFTLSRNVRLSMLLSIAHYVVLNLCSISLVFFFFRMRQLEVSLSLCSQLTVSGIGFSRSRLVGRERVGHSWMIWWVVCSVAPQWQAAEGRRPQKCMFALNRPTPVRSRFRVVHSLRGRSVPGGKLMFGTIERWAGRGVCCQLLLHA